MDLNTAIAEAVTRAVAPLLRELFAEHTAGCSCTAAPKVRPGAPPRTAYTAQEVADSLGITRKAVYDLIHDGQLGHLRAGKHYRIPVTAFDEFRNAERGQLPR